MPSFFVSLFTSSPVKITPGRIIAILNYCYELCKTYTLQNVVAASLASFISTVAKWLYKYFIEAKLYEWLDKQGGWVGHVACTIYRICEY